MMNKDEAVRELSKVTGISVAYAEDLYDSFFPKPVVPQFVADWYGIIKDSFNYDLIDTINGMPYGDDEEDFSEIEKWLDDNNDSLTTLVNMHQFGYEVEKEKQYIVKIKGIVEAYNCLNYNTVQKMYSISTTTELGGVYITKFTRKELEDAGFGEVFDNPMFEIEEVDDGND